MPNDKSFYVDLLQSEECQCEQSKRSGMAFCYDCYNELTVALRIGLLHNRVGDGFEEAYDDCVRYLNED